jgi:hypothetical protein
MSTIRELKHEEKIRRRTERIGTPHIRLVRQCFWTWPWGHRYRDGVCVVCNKKQPEHNYHL